MTQYELQTAIAEIQARAEQRTLTLHEAVALAKHKRDLMRLQLQERIKLRTERLRGRL